MSETFEFKLKGRPDVEMSKRCRCLPPGTVMMMRMMMIRDSMYGVKIVAIDAKGISAFDF